MVKQQSIQMPRPGDNQVLVEVKACALNIGDYQRFQTKNGKIPISTRITNKLMGYVGKPLGAEIAGIVTETGKKVTHVKVGDAVFGKTAGTGCNDIWCFRRSWIICRTVGKGCRSFCNRGMQYKKYRTCKISRL